MNPIEVAAIGLTIICVLFAVKRSILQYPSGILATLLFFVIFLQARLYASMALQVFFVFVQAYGWWFWLRGDAGKPPSIKTWPASVIAALTAGGFIFAVAASTLLNALTDAEMAFWDSAIFGLSVVAQFLLDRKTLENWIVWAIVNGISICVYASQGLWMTAALYVGLLLNTVWGYTEWRGEMVRLRPAPMDRLF